MFSKILAAAFGLFTLVSVSVAPAYAATVTLTFDGVNNGCGVCPGFPTSIIESGYTISGSPAGGGSVHLDDGGSSFSNTVSFSGPSSFAVSTLQVFGFPSSFVGGNNTALAYNNVQFQGFRGGSLVASMLFSTGIVGGLFDVGFSALFSNLDLFSITQTAPSAAELAASRGGFCFTAPCGHVDIDNVVLISAVPLPAMIPAMVASLALLGLFGRRRRDA